MSSRLLYSCNYTENTTHRYSLRYKVCGKRNKVSCFKNKNYYEIGIKNLKTTKFNWLKIYENLLKFKIKHIRNILMSIIDICSVSIIILLSNCKYLCQNIIHIPIYDYIYTYISFSSNVKST